jgi:hypothetical protein
MSLGRGRQLGHSSGTLCQFVGYAEFGGHVQHLSDAEAADHLDHVGLRRFALRGFLGPGLEGKRRRSAQNAAA